MIKSNLPVILLKNLVLLPLGEARIEFNNDISKKVIDISKMYHDNEILIVTPINDLEEVPDTNDLPKAGVVAKISSRIDLPNGNSRVVLTGLRRVKVLNYVNYSNEKDVLESIVVPFPKIDYSEVEETALLRKLMQELEKYISNNPYISNAILARVKGVNELEKLTDLVANFIPISNDKKIKLMLDNNRVSRARRLITEINIELAVLDLENKIDNKLKLNIDNMQKDMILKEKLRLIKEELGEKDSKSSYLSKLNVDINNNHIPKNIKDRLSMEINKYESTLESSPELGVIKSYIDYLLSIPFGKYSKNVTNLKKVEEALNKTHYGLDEVKNRIIEYVAVSTNDGAKTPVICLVGPPGVGKTTLAESISNALNKKFVKISLGGINDPNELIGHRKTYIGSAPGKIITSIVKSEVMNPVILLDEVDKMSKDYKGDPVNVLLDILDSKQSESFVDNYIEEKIDLSKVTWILTANDKNEIPLVLRDRLEIIELSSYLNYEKVSIAKYYLINSSLKRNGVTKSLITFLDDALIKIIEDYTKESGVRELDRLINRIIRKIITSFKLENKPISKTVVTIESLTDYLGIPKYEKNSYNNMARIGYARGLAYTPYGGETLEIEVSGYEGKEDFITSGHLGETLKESIMVSIGYIKANKKLFNIDEDKFKQTLHINFREGGIPKEGPSAGTIITTAVLSYLTGKKVPSNISSSGEITLLGDILPVGGLREKSLAAIKAGINKVYVSYMNKKDIDILDKEIKKNVKFIFVKNYLDIYNDVFKEVNNNGRNKKNENAN